jgi:hypothetical protein
MESESLVTVDVTHTHYDVIKEVITDDLGWDYIEHDPEEEFDILWSDLPISN